MHITNVNITNVKSISSMEIDLAESGIGWHVLIGDNSSGKTTIMRAIALALLGESDAIALSYMPYTNLINWVQKSKKEATISVTVFCDKEGYDQPKRAPTNKETAVSSLAIKQNDDNQLLIKGAVTPNNALSGQHASNSGWFLAAYGPFRRLGVDSNHIERSKLAACQTIFGDNFALKEVDTWLKNLALDATRNKKEKHKLECVIKFINTSQLLPNGAILENNIDSTGIKLKDSAGASVGLNDMSDGFRSILSMTLDIIRVMLIAYKVEQVFPEKSATSIKVPGVVLIDEIDAHLHPEWQTRIGEWFTNYFPNIQFIVTTHSPLICRACDKKDENGKMVANGSIWRLSKDEITKEPIIEKLSEAARDKLVKGNILDAYGTELFGKNTVRSEVSNALLSRLGRLNIQYALGKITAEEAQERSQLNTIFQTDAPTGF
jgi:predicted ATP-dependent endonuclease of OLD family